MKRALTAVALLTSALVLGCSAGGDDDKEVPTVVSNQEIAAALTSFAEAFANYDPSALSDLLSITCGSADRTTADATSRTLQALLGGDYQLEVVAAGLVLETADDRVVVAPEQPEGVLSATVELAVPLPATPGEPTAEELQGALSDPLPFEAAVEFVREDGAWRVANCGELFRSDEEEDDEGGAVEPTATVIPTP